MSAENRHALTGAYALDALEPAECAAFEAHLATCRDCRDEVAGMLEAAARLGQAAAVPPPPGLRERVLAQAAATPQVPASLDAFRASRVPSWRRWPAAVAAAVVLVVGGVAGGTAVVREIRADQAAAAAQAHMMRIATAPDAVSHDIALGTSHVVMSKAMSAAALVGEDVPMPVRAGMAYQLWMVHADGSTAPGPTFMPEGGEVLAFVEGDLSHVTALSVTEEPMAGSDRMTGEVIAVVAL